jgi:hypothetical protein
MHRSTAALGALTASVLVALFAPAVASSLDRAPKTPQRLTLYSVATAEQYQNYSDDRQRGYGNNPFGNFKDTSSTKKRTKIGPFPGDLEYFELIVFKDAALKQRVGTANVTCQFNVNKNAFCNAKYQLKGGAIVGAGTIDFKSSSFTIAIVGGSGTYQGLRGELNATPAAHRAQRLAFDLSSP